MSGSVQHSFELSSFEFNSEELPSTDQFPRTRELMSRLPAPVEIDTEQPAAFKLHQRSLQLDDLRAWAMTNQPMVARRSARLIRQSDPETYNICLLRQGAIGATSDRQLARCGPYDLYVNDSSRPFELRMESANADDPHALVRTLGVQFPKKLLPLPQSRTDRLSGQLISATEGVGALFARFLMELVANQDSYLPSDGMRLGTVLTDLAAALFAHQLEVEGALAPETRQRNLVLRIRAFIRQHLHNPGPDPGAIAAAHYISLSYLHRLFRGEHVGGGLDPPAAAGGRPTRPGRSGTGDRPRPPHRYPVGVQPSGGLQPPVPRHLWRHPSGLPPPGAPARGPDRLVRA